jgi:hypothetical protein
MTANGLLILESSIQYNPRVWLEPNPGHCDKARNHYLWVVDRAAAPYPGL